MKKLFKMVFYFFGGVVGFCALLVLWFFVANLPDETKIGDGYKYIKINNGEYAISGPVFIIGHVSDYETDTKYIYGLRKKSHTEFPPGQDQPYGYFIIHKVDKTSEMGLSKEAFYARLKELGVSLELDE